MVDVLALAGRRSPAPLAPRAHRDSARASFSLPSSSSLKACSVPRSLRTTWRPSSPGCTTADCWSSRSWPPAISSARGARSCWCATSDAACTGRRSAGRDGSARSGSAIVLFVAVLFSYELFDLWALPRGTAVLVLAYFGAALVDRSRVFRRDVLQVPVPDRPVQLRRVDHVPAGAARPAAGDAAARAARSTASRADRQTGAAGLRARALPAVQGRQPRLHLLPGLRAGVSARQRRARGARSRRRTAGSPPALRHRPAGTSAATSPRWPSCLRSAAC